MLTDCLVLEPEGSTPVNQNVALSEPNEINTIKACLREIHLNMVFLLPSRPSSLSVSRKFTNQNYI